MVVDVVMCLSFVTVLVSSTLHKVCGRGRLIFFLFVVAELEIPF